jgi:hypothetical protein
MPVFNVWWRRIMFNQHSPSTAQQGTVKHQEFKKLSKQIALVSRLEDQNEEHFFCIWMRQCGVNL